MSCSEWRGRSTDAVRQRLGRRPMEDGGLRPPPPPPRPPPHTLRLGVCVWMPLVNGTGNSPSPGQSTHGVVKQDKSSGGSVDTTKTRSGPQRVRMSSGERPIAAAKGKQSHTEALCQPPPPPPTFYFSPAGAPQYRATQHHARAAGAPFARTLRPGQLLKRRATTATTQTVAVEGRTKTGNGTRR